MKKVIFRGILPLLTLALLTACFSGRESGKKASSHRLNVSKHGVILDANYDPRLDNLIPGYKILTVAVTNQSVDVMRMNPLKDKWEVVDAMGKKRKAINSLRIKDPSVFNRLPGKVQQLIDYPVGISVGYSETVDLFFPDHVDLNAFRTISYYNSERRQLYDMMTNLESPTHVPAGRSAGTPVQGAAVEDPRFR
ncbi:MAG: hypothetical protein R3257_01205 [bacterium]|nr:hypothetical protein [bacterium]